MAQPPHAAFWLILLAAWGIVLPARAEEKLILLDTYPRLSGRFKVAPDGSKLYFAGPKYLVFDAQGQLTDQVGVPQGNSPRDLIPLPDGWFIACDSYASGHLALCRPDGTEARVLVRKEGGEKGLRGDMTGWTSPNGAAVDVERRRIFVIDTTMAPAGTPDPDWSRIAMFDFDGKYLGDVNRYDGQAKDKDDARRTWYDDIAVDPGRRRLYALARRTRELLAFDYEGKLLARAPAQGNGEGLGGLAVFPDGRIAAGMGAAIQIYSPELKPLRALRLPAEAAKTSVLDVECDASGRLYASVRDAGITFLRWSSNLEKTATFGPRYQRIEVQFADTVVTAGTRFAIKVHAGGRPQPTRPDQWQVLARPSDGSDLRWQALPAAYRAGELLVTAPTTFRGPFEVAVRFGQGPIAWSNRANDPYLQKTIAFLRPGAVRSLAVVPASGRTAFRAGESIPLQLVRRGAVARSVGVHLSLEREGEPLASAEVQVGRLAALAVPAAVTRRLSPGRYLLKPVSPGYESYPFQVNIAPAEADSPFQRILYHEFDNTPATARQPSLADVAEQMSYIRAYCRAAAGLGFTRETDRLIGTLNPTQGPAGWQRDRTPVNVAAPGFAPAAYYALPDWTSNWEAEYYLDQAVRYGLHYDSQLLPHCSGVRFREPWLRDLDPILQRGAQWFGRYPSFYGFNYNDEMFFGGFASQWTREDDQWLQRLEAEKFKGKPHADTLLYALRVMYDSFNASVRQANPAARLTATPMWQFPATEGSYAPVIYRGMSETYSHFLSEGYALPWYPAHSVDFLRRPGLPLMGVFDNGHHGEDGDVYLKNLVQVAARGVQGTGVEHTRPFADSSGASAYRTANLLARMYGPVFADVPPANEAAVLYSYTQDVTERRNVFGTPHWERLYALYGAGLMAGVPMSIVYEDDLLAGWLLPAGKPRVPMLFLVGQTQPLPAAVQNAIAAFTAAGGKVFTDADSAPYPGAKALPLKTHELKPLFHEGYASDTTFPLFQPVLERLAAGLSKAVGAQRRFPMDTDDPWVSKNQFDGGAVRYLMVASETSPYPWDAGIVWSLGAMYNKSYLPRTVSLSFPAGSGVVYDVFEHTVVRPAINGQTATLAADLTTFPGRLYALAPAPLGAPKLSAGIAADVLHYQVEVAGDRGQRLAARVPLRIRLLDGRKAVLEIYRGTGPDGTFAGRIPLPATAKPCTLEVTELLGGRGSVVEASGSTALGELLVSRPDVEVQREAQIRQLLQEAKGSLTLLTANDKVLTNQQRRTLTLALRAQGVELKEGAALPKEASPGVYLTAGCMEGQYATGNLQGDLLGLAIHHGLLQYPPSATVPGPERGLITAVFAPRGQGEHCLVLLGGDREGLDRTVRTFATWLETPAPPLEKDAPAPAGYPLTGKAAEVAPVPRLQDRVGVKLSGVTVAADGKHLVVTADGYLRNLALVEDLDDQARVVRAARVGQAPRVASAYVSADGKQFGASAREIARFGQGFHLLDAGTEAEQVFAAFGDIGRQQHHFAVSSTGDTVIAPGTYGVVCWRRAGGIWKEAWALDFWKEFSRLDWPVSADAERIPQFHAFIPAGADYALILYGEFSNNGWVTPEQHCTAWLAALGLADGKERWRFHVPILKTLLLPTLHTSPDGSKLLLQVQMGSWNRETFRMFAVSDGQMVSSWDSATTPLDVAVADATGIVAGAFRERLLEVRRPDGSILYSRLWRDQPVSLAFAADGRTLYVADDSGRLTCLDADGQEKWHVETGCLVRLAAHGDRVYAAGWDGRLRCFGGRGQARWVLDCTPALNIAQPMALVAASAKHAGATIHQARRAPTTTSQTPAGDNLLRNGKATLTLGGTKGWMSQGQVLVKAEALTNGQKDDVLTPWLHLGELFWDAQAGRQVWAEIRFQTPTDVEALTVYENPSFPDSWPTEGLVQVWDDRLQQWKTAAFGLFLRAATNTYSLHLRQVTRLRYVPWNSYYRNFYTSEIAVR